MGRSPNAVTTRVRGRTLHAAILVALLAVAVGPGCANDLGSSTMSAELSQRVSAVYLAPRTGGVLDQRDLKSHPSVVVVRTQKALEEHAGTRVAVWIDRDAVDSLDKEWLSARSEAHYPIAFVGYSDTLYAFRDVLPLANIKGPYVDWKNQRPRPGFAVWMLRSASPTSTSAYSKSFSDTPTVDAVLEVTDDLLESPTP